MNEIVNNCYQQEMNLIKMHLRQSVFMYSACGPFTKNKEKIKKTNKTGGSRHIYQNDHIEPVFNMTWLMDILKIQLEEQLLTKYFVIKHLVLLNFKI